jgi:hypothetical protein
MILKRLKIQSLEWEIASGNGLPVRILQNGAANAQSGIKQRGKPEIAYSKMSDLCRFEKICDKASKCQPEL